MEKLCVFDPSRLTSAVRLYALKVVIKQSMHEQREDEVLGSGRCPICSNHPGLCG